MSVKGGKPMDKEFQREVLRAEMCAVASRISFQHGPRIVDALMDHFEVTTRKPFKEKRIA